MSIAARGNDSGRRSDILRSLGFDDWRNRTGQQAAPACDEAGSSDLERLRAAVASCTRCDLSKSRTQTVFGAGAADADWMIIGEAPGADEDRQGKPFVGAAGKLLNEMLRAVGLARDDVFIANILKCRPPGNRNPHAGEVEACAPYLEAQIDLIRPRVILAVGRIAAHHLLSCDDPVGRLRGRVYEFGAAATPLIVTYHPAYLLRSPEQKAKSWDDLKLARDVMARRRAA